MEFLTIKAQYLYAKNSRNYQQVERYNLAITYEQQFTDKYPKSTYASEALALKKSSDKGIIETKSLLEEAANDEKVAHRFAKKDTVTSQPPSEKANDDKKMPN